MGIGMRDCGWRFAFSSHKFMALPAVSCTILPSDQLALGLPVHGCRSAMALPSPYAPHLMHHTSSPDNILWWPPLACTPWSLSARAAFAQAVAADPPHLFGAMSFHLSARTLQHRHRQPPSGLASNACPPNAHRRAAILLGCLGWLSLASFAAWAAIFLAFFAFNVVALVTEVSRCGASGWLFPAWLTMPIHWTVPLMIDCPDAFRYLVGLHRPLC